jgi:hypothetical protein
VIPSQPTPAVRAAMQRRYDAAQALERTRQIARENSRYGRATGTDMHAVQQAEHEYDLAGVSPR